MYIKLSINRKNIILEPFRIVSKIVTSRSAADINGVHSRAELPAHRYNLYLCLETKKSEYGKDTFLT